MNFKESSVNLYELCLYIYVFLFSSSRAINFRFEDNAVKNLVKTFNESLDVAQNANSKMNTLMNQSIKVIDVIALISSNKNEAIFIDYDSFSN
jgi:hypothetical protein